MNQIEQDAKDKASGTMKGIISGTIAGVGEELFGCGCMLVIFGFIVGGVAKIADWLNVGKYIDAFLK